MPEEISKYLMDNREGIRKKFRQGMLPVSGEIRRSYERSVETGRSILQGDGSFQRWFFFNHFLHAGFLQARIDYDDETLYTFGAEILPWRRGRAFSSSKYPVLEENNLIVIEVRPHGDDRLLIQGILPSTLEQAGRKVLHDDVLPFAIRYYGNLPYFINQRPLDLWDPIEKEMTDSIESSLSRNDAITLSHLLFMNMRPYFEHMGEHRSLEVLNGIEIDIRNNLEPEERFFKLTPLSYVIISPGTESDEVRRRFRGVVFYVESLVLDFQFYQTVVDSFPIRANEIWRAIHL